MTDLYELLKRRQDELRGREEDWIDRLGAWWRRVDRMSLAFHAIMIPHLALLFAIEAFVLWKVFAS